jgi:type IV pilus assembly protein PilN
VTVIRVNLLPHRADRRRRQKIAFHVATGVSAAAGVVLVLMVYLVLEGYLGAQRARNDRITRENAKLDVQIKEIAALRTEIQALRARQKAVEDLQSDRNQPVYLLDELVHQTPEGIYLRSVKQEDRKVNVSGWAASNERVSEFLRNLQNNGRWVERPELIEIKVAGQGPQSVQRRVFEFSLNFSLRPNAPAPAQAAAPAAAGKAPAADAAAPARKS